MPGGDTREWGCFGIVQPATSGSGASIRFYDDDGNPLPEGYLVDVKLMPSGTIVPCLVASFLAGQGEACFFPFNAGDEVYVMVPEGDERAGCTIVGRCNQALDVFPLQVAGQDVTQNNFGFVRMRTPFIVETASSLLLRHSVSGAFLAFDLSGALTMAPGDGGSLHLGPDFLGFQTLDSSGSVQVVPANGSQGNQVQMNADATSFLLDGSASQLLTTGTLTLATAGNQFCGHALTVEQFLTIMQGIVIPPTGLTGPTMWAALAAAITAGNATPLDTTVITPALTLALTTPGTPAPGTFGVACPGLLIG